MYITANSLGYTVTDIPLAGFISRFLGVVTKKRLYPSITPRQPTKMQLMAEISEQNGKQIVGMCQKIKNMLGPEKLHMVSDGCHFSAC